MSEITASPNPLSAPTLESAEPLEPSPPHQNSTTPTNEELRLERSERSEEEGGTKGGWSTGEQGDSEPAGCERRRATTDTKNQEQETESISPPPNLKPKALNFKPGQSGYSPALAALICERMVTTPQSVAKLCEAPDMPGVATVFRWLHDHPEFKEIFLLARETQAHLLIDQCLDIVDDTSHDLITDEKGRHVPNRAHFQRIKIQIAFRQWIASRLLPGIYGNAKAKAAAHNEELRTKNQEQTSPEPGFVLTEERRMELIEKRHKAFEAIRAAEAAATPPSDRAAERSEATSNEAPSASNQERRTKNEEPSTPPVAPPPPPLPTLKQWRAHFPEREHAYPPWYHRP